MSFKWGKPHAAASLLPSASADGLKDLEAKPLPLWVFNPFHRLHLKGLKPTKEPAKPGTITYPSAEADGKREAAAWGLPHLNLIGAGGIGHSQRAVRLYFRHRVFSSPAEGLSVLRSVFLLHSKYIRYLYFIHKLREYVAQRVLFCPVTHIFWEITSIFSCRFGKPIYLYNDSVVGSGSQGAGSITYCKHFTKIIPTQESSKFLVYRNNRQ